MHVHNVLESFQLPQLLYVSACAQRAGSGPVRGALAWHSETVCLRGNACAPCALSNACVRFEQEVERVRGALAGHSMMAPAPSLGDPKFGWANLHGAGSGWSDGQARASVNEARTTSILVSCRGGAQQRNIDVLVEPFDEASFKDLLKLGSLCLLKACTYRQLLAQAPVDFICIHEPCSESFRAHLQMVSGEHPPPASRSQPDPHQERVDLGVGGVGCVAFEQPLLGRMQVLRAGRLGRQGGPNISIERTD
eukprot:scaffold111054_cov17-Tisochrysis_lutea.AAC.1